MLTQRKYEAIRKHLDKLELDILNEVFADKNIFRNVDISRFVNGKTEKYVRIILKKNGFKLKTTLLRDVFGDLYLVYYTEY